jgi:hypothetical protein
LAADRDSLIEHSQQEDRAILGERLVMQESLFYEFRLEDQNLRKLAKLVVPTRPQVMLPA